MKTIFKMLIVVVLFFTVNLINAQTYKNTENANGVSGFDTESAQENFFLNQNVNSVNTNTISNSVFISQVGDNNTLVSKTKSLDANVSITQNGNGNLTVLDINSAELKETVIQDGNNNTLLDFSPYKSNLRNATINQTGNNQNLTMFGTNALSEKIKVSMQGQNQSIIIRNF